MSLMELAHSCLKTHRGNIGKYCRPRPDAANVAFNRGSSLFALNPGIKVAPLKIEMDPFHEPAQHKWDKG